MRPPVPAPSVRAQLSSDGSMLMFPAPHRRGLKYRFVYTGIRVRNLEKSLDFYTKVLGMKVSRREKMGHGGIYVALRSPRSTQELELNLYPPGSRFATSYRRGEEMDHLAFVVDDVLIAYRQLVRKGAKVAIDPAHAKGSEVYVQDPDGI